MASDARGSEAHLPEWYVCCLPSFLLLLRLLLLLLLLFLLLLLLLPPSEVEVPELGGSART